MQELPPGNPFLQQVKAIFKAFITEVASQSTVELNIQKPTPLLIQAHNVSFNKGWWVKPAGMKQIPPCYSRSTQASSPTLNIQRQFQELFQMSEAFPSDQQ